MVVFELSTGRRHEIETPIFTMIFFFLVFFLLKFEFEIKLLIFYYENGKKVKNNDIKGKIRGKIHLIIGFFSTKKCVKCLVIFHIFCSKEPLKDISIF